MSNIVSPELPSNATVEDIRNALRRMLNDAKGFVRVGGALEGSARAPSLRKAVLIAAHKLLDHADATAADPSRGTLIAGNASGLWQSVAAGGSGRVLRANASATPGIEWTNGTVTLLATPPASGVAVTVPTTAAFRLVFGKMTLTSAPGNQASIAIGIETAAGSGAYTTLRTEVEPAGATSRSATFAFVTLTGCRYRFTLGGLAGAVETINDYSFYDL